LARLWLTSSWMPEKAGYRVQGIGYREGPGIEIPFIP
jgi:hypothetical protein